MDNKKNIIDDFRSVCTDNIRALSHKQTVFIYKDDVLEETKKLCDKLEIKLKITQVDDYYIVKNLDTSRRKKDEKNN